MNIQMVDKEYYDTYDDYLEEFHYTDKNNYSWLLKRKSNSFVLSYNDSEYLCVDWFYINADTTYRNTNYFYFSETNFDNFYTIRCLIQKSYTDEILFYIEALLKREYNMKNKEVYV